MSFDPITELEAEIMLYLLHCGDDGPIGISHSIDRPPESISRSLGDLKEETLVIDKSPGVWKLTTLGFRVIRAVIIEQQIDRIPCNFPNMPEDDLDENIERFEDLDEIMEGEINIDSDTDTDSE